MFFLNCEWCMDLPFVNPQEAVPPPKKMFVIQNEQNNGSLKQFKTFFSAKHFCCPPFGGPTFDG